MTAIATTADRIPPGLDLGRVAGLTWTAVLQNGLAMAVLAAPLALAPIVARWIVAQLAGGGLLATNRSLATLEGAAIGFLVALPVNSLLLGAISVMAVASLNGEGPLSPPQALGAALRRWPVMVAVSLLSSIGTTAGAILLIVPGLWLACVWTVVGPAAVLEPTGLLERLRAPRARVRSRSAPLMQTAGIQ